MKMKKGQDIFLFGTEDFLKSSVPNCFLQNPDKATIMETDIRKGVECI